MRAILVLAWKDLVMEARTRELVTSTSLVAFLTVVILGLAVGEDPGAAAAVTPAILWVTVAFGATIGLARSHAIEQERLALQGVLLAPVDRAYVYLGKCAANLVLVVVLEAVVVVATAVFVNPEVGRRAPALALPFALGAVGFSAIGTLLGSMTATTRLREVLLPILLLPVVLPVIIVSLAGVEMALGGAGIARVLGPVRVLVAYDVVFLLLGAWLFEYVVAE